MCKAYEIMTPDQFRAVLADLGLSQAGFARFAMVDARTVRRWCDGTRAVPGPVVALLRLAGQRLAVSRPDTAALNTPAAADARESAD
jgi:DNA-binding transcriptional regulator YiaG